MDIAERERQIRLDVETVLDIPGGRRLLGNILYLCRHNELSFDANSFANTAFLEGIRYVGVQIEKELGAEKTAECLKAFDAFEEQFMEGEHGSRE